MAKREYAWVRAERLLAGIEGEIDAATLARAGYSVGWFMTIHRARCLMRELKSYGLVKQISKYGYVSNRHPSLRAGPGPSLGPQYVPHRPH